MRVIRATDYRRMPWKNGGGETSEIAVFPEGADTSTFGWRISMARVGSDGPFSSFQGVDRTLTILEGDGLELNVNAQQTIQLTRDVSPFSFAGDTPVFARLLGKEVLDLNVMSQREQYEHWVERRYFSESFDLNYDSPIFAIFSCEGSLHLEGPNETCHLEKHDSVFFLDGSHSGLKLHGRGAACLISINPV